MYVDDHARAFYAFLEHSLGRPCDILLQSGSRYTGTLATIDANFNVVLTNAVEIVQGAPREPLPSVFIRGTNVMNISTD
jgi:small nuclear ribonucleoprotein (snRNP)-like protein